MEAIGATASIAQLISLTGEVLVAGYGFIAKVKRAPREIGELLRETVALNSLLDQLQELADDVDQKARAEDEKSSSTPRSALNRLEELGVFEEFRKMMIVVMKVIKTCEQIDGERFKNLGKKIIWPFKEKESKDIMVQLGRLRETLSAAVVVDSARSLKLLEETAQDIDRRLIETFETLSLVQLNTSEIADDVSYIKSVVHTNMKEEERLAIRRWLFPDGLDTDSNFKAVVKTRHHGTGKWLLDSNHLKDWETGEHGLMWLHGIAGAGKTVLAATLASHFQESNEISLAMTLQFFCDHRDPNKRSLENFLHAVTKQLLESDPSCLNVAYKVYKKQKFDSASYVARALTVEGYIELIRNLAIRWKQVYLVVDALDECIELQVFIDGLTTLAAKSNIRMILTSRQTVDLERVIGPIAGYPIAIRHHAWADIDIYLDEEIMRRKALGTLKVNQHALEGSIKQAIRAKAGGMFLIAKLQLDYICRLRSDRAIRAALTSLPSSLYSIYDDILHDLIVKNPDDIDDIRLVLTWLLGSKVPLTLQQLAEAVSIQPGDQSLDRSGIITDVMDLAACCGALVSLRTQETTNEIEDLRGRSITLISLSHASVEEYLKSGKMGRGLAVIFPMHEKTIHRQIARTCIQYIGFDDFKQPLMSPIKRSHNEVSRLEGDFRIDRHILRERASTYALADYASRYWPDHLRLSTDGMAPHKDTMSLLSWFLSSAEHEGNYISWQQMYHHDITWYCPERPPLYYAIEFRIPYLVSLLLPSDGHVDDIRYGQAALHVAARCGDMDTVVQLIDKGASIDLYSSPTMDRSLTPLHSAAEGGQAAVIRVLIERGGDIHAQSASYSTPFYRAARSGSLEALKILYEHGSDINARTWDDFTPLVEALEQGNARVAEQLLEWGADPTIRHDQNSSPLTLLTKHFNKTEEEIHLNIKKIRDRSEGNFKGYLKGLMPLAFLYNYMLKDTRPGTQRDQDYRYSYDGTIALGGARVVGDLQEEAEEFKEVMVEAVNSRPRWDTHDRF